MRKLIIALVITLSGSVMANTTNITQYSLDAGKLHKGGKAEVQILPEVENFLVRLSYDINKKALVPIPDKILKGSKDFELPRSFETELGYQELQSKGAMEMDKAWVKFIGRKEIDGLSNAYLVEILPKNGKSRIEIAYHPSLPGLGWKYVKLKFLGNFPLLNGYETVAHLKT